jgi:hypothetical protein
VAKIPPEKPGLQGIFEKMRGTKMVFDGGFVLS